MIRRIKAVATSWATDIVHLFRAVVWPIAESTSPKDYFTRVYRQNYWGGKASRSGAGSEGKFADQKIGVVRELIADCSVRTIIDLGCGDVHWMKEVIPFVERYHGVDVVPALIDSNQRAFGSSRVSFQCLDLTNEAEQSRLLLRRADLVLCLDVFGHLLNAEVEALLGFIFDGIDVRYLLVTNRRDARAMTLERGKTRRQGIDLERYPLFARRSPPRIRQIPALSRNDYFDLYDLAARRS